MTDACPEPADFAAYQDGALKPDRREALERHWETCAPCRDFLRLLGQAAEEPAVVPWRWATAAALLVSVVLGWVLQRQAATPSGGELRPVPVQVHAAGRFPQGLLEARQASLARLMDGAEIVLQAPSRVRVEGARRLRAEAGTFWVEVTAGASLTVDLPGATLLLRRGALAVSLPESRQASWLLPEALAEDASAKVWVLRGDAELSATGTLLPAMTRLEMGPAGWTQAPCPPAEILEMTKAMALAAASAPGLEVVPDLPVPAAYRWVVALSGRDPSAEVALTFGTEAGWHRWVAGLGAFPPSAREVLEVIWDGRGFTGRLNGVPLVSVARDRVGGFLLPAERPRWGISVRGGAATVVRSILQEGE